MKKSWKKFAIIIFSSALMLAACGGEKKESTSAGDEKTYIIGITQIVEHPSLNAATDGFKKALEDAGLKVEYDTQIAQGDPSLSITAAENLVAANVDLIFANSTPSAQAAVSKTTDIPIIFTSVTDAVGAELVKSNESPGGNVTGTIDSHPDAISNTMKFLKEELNAKNVGMVYNAGEQNSVAQVNAVKEMLKDMDMTVVEAAVATSADVKQATESLIGKIDSLYIITDNTVVNALESVIDVANANKLPMMVGEFDSVKRGGLAAYGFEYFDIGYEAGEMAVKILKDGKKPADIPVQVPQKLMFIMNKDTATKIDLEIKDEWNADFIE
ncbi:ABC transporter substrate-binding protein [Sporosarcina sp. FA9]|uniref:ABC transporter substrate-binding protein n=1 Tax=Sporosarcina sp. FA9 TaxID=3413030 RepID=UPI003F658104